MSQQRDRGLAFSIVFEFILALGFFSIVWLFLNEPAQLLIELSNQNAPQGSEWARGAGYIHALWNYSPVFFAAAAVVFLQARAAFESKGGVR